MGNTGNVTGLHLHFEIKKVGTLGAGYTTTPPDVNGYFDPWKYFSTTSITPVPVSINQAGLNVRRGPGTNYQAFTTLNVNQKFVAFAKSGNWYRIYLPCEKNSCAGWIAKTDSSCTGGICATEDPTATQVEVEQAGVGGGLFVRPSPGSSLKHDKIYDGQKFVTFGTPQAGSNCSSNWYQIHLLASSEATSGWSCGDFLIVPGTTPTVDKPVVITQGATAPTQTGATLHGVVSPSAAMTSVFYDYGLTEAYGESIAGESFIPGPFGRPVQKNISGLSCGTLYHFGVGATNAGGTTNGNDLTFTTLDCATPVPSVTSLSPSNTAAEGGGFSLSVNGSNFVSGSVIRWKGVNRLTTFVSSTVLRATIPASDIATAGTAQITVFSPAPGGGPSNARVFTINSPSNPVPSVTSLRAQAIPQ